MKFFNTILIAGFLCLVPVLAQAEGPQDYSRENLYKTCQEGVAEQPIGESFDKDGYCNCVTDRLLPHAAAMDEEDSEENRRNAMRDTVPCMNQHLKPHIIKMCEEMNYNSEAEGMPVNMNCECYYKKVVSNFVETYAEGGELNEATAAKQAERAQKAMRVCAGK